MTTDSYIRELKRISFDKNDKISSSKLMRFSDEVNEDIIHHTNWLDNDTGISIRINCIIKGFKSKPICPVCKNEHQLWNKVDQIFRKNCSSDCSHRSEETIAHMKHTKLERYGDKNYTNIEKQLATTSAFSDDKWNEITTKRKETCLERYGVENGAQLDSSKLKAKETCVDLYGVDHHSKTSKWKNLIKSINLEKYGVNNVSQVGWVKDKKIKTSQKNYGTDYPNQNYEQFKKVFDNSATKKKEYTFPSGRIINIQGYEPDALDVLIYNYKYNEYDIEHEPFGIEYTFEGKSKMYYPDFYIRSKNLIIEVKSTYTFNKDMIKNIAKEDSCIEQGYNFEFLIIHK